MFKLKPLSWEDNFNMWQCELPHPLPALIIMGSFDWEPEQYRLTFNDEDINTYWTLEGAKGAAELVLIRLITDLTE